nr:hypothetical protein Iba_chr04fCG10610 [Ipomoea batatas]
MSSARESSVTPGSPPAFLAEDTLLPLLPGIWITVLGAATLPSLLLFPATIDAFSGEADDPFPGLTVPSAVSGLDALFPLLAVTSSINLCFTTPASLTEHIPSVKLPAIAGEKQSRSPLLQALISSFVIISPDGASDCPHHQRKVRSKIFLPEWAIQQLPSSLQSNPCQLRLSSSKAPEQLPQDS